MAWLPLLAVLGGKWSSCSLGKVQVSLEAAVLWRLQAGTDFSLPQVSLYACGGATEGANEARTWDALQELMIKATARSLEECTFLGSPQPTESQCGMEPRTLGFRDLSGDLMHAKAEKHWCRAC